MSRFTKALWPIALLGAVASCALDQGEPWARASFELSVGFEIDETRLDNEGRLITPGDWAIELDPPTLHVDALILQLAGASGAEGFDPADPPDGYSLCHNGHCHADDGRLVDYDEIAAEVATAAGVGAPTVVQSVDTDATLEVATVLPLRECSDDCNVPIGDFVSVAVVLRDVEFVGTAYDRRLDDRARVGVDGVAFSTVVTGPIELIVPVAGSAGRGEPVRAHFDVTLNLPPSLFDGVDWATQPSASAPPSSDTDDLAAQIANEIRHSTQLSVSLDR
jgi:hypothetical protein